MRAGADPLPILPGEEGGLICWAAPPCTRLCVVWEPVGDTHRAPVQPAAAGCMHGCFKLAAVCSTHSPHPLLLLCPLCVAQDKQLRAATEQLQVGRVLLIRSSILCRKGAGRLCVSITGNDDVADVLVVQEAC